MTIKKKKIVAAAILIICLSTFFIFFRKSDSDCITLYGNVDVRLVDISFQVGGRINEMRFDEGDAVKKGDVLATLDDKDYRTNYKKSRAEAKRLAAVSENAGSIYQRNVDLCKVGATSVQNCTDYLNAKKETAAALESAAAASEQAKNQLDYTKVYAPDAGIISSRIQEPGATVQAGQPIYTLTKTNPILIRAYVPGDNLADVKYGTAVKVVIDSKNRATGKKREYQGRVGYISPVAEFTPKTVQTEDLRADLVYRINILVDEADEFLKQGMPATIKIDTAQKTEGM